MRRTLVRIAPDVSALAGAAAAAFAAWVAGGTPDAPRRVLLSGGTTPERLYRALSGPTMADRVAWESVECFLGDERAVPADHPDSNYGMIRRTLLEPLGIRAPRMHRIRAEEADLDAVARDYEALLRQRFGVGPAGVPRFDLILLGLGADGHTASIFPGAKLPTVPACLVTAVRVASLGTERITVTPALLAAARRLMFLAAGPERADAVARTLAPAGGEPATVAAGMRPTSGETIWLLDRAAARLLRPDSSLAVEEIRA